MTVIRQAQLAACALLRPFPDSRPRGSWPLPSAGCRAGDRLPWRMLADGGPEAIVTAVPRSFWFPLTASARPGGCQNTLAGPDTPAAVGRALSGVGGWSARQRRGRAGRGPSLPAAGGHPAGAAPFMSQDELDPVIHVPARLRLMVTLATLPEATTCPSPGCRT